MNPVVSDAAEPDFEDVLAHPWATFDEGLLFFRGRGMLNAALTRLAADLDRVGIDYAVIDAVALNRHGYRRFTEDIDLLMSRSDLQRFHAELVGRGYVPAFPGATKMFKTAQDNIRVEIITSGEFPGDGKPKPIAFPIPREVSEEIDGVKTLKLAKLIELKLASGMTAPDRLKDLADVQETIKARGLSEDLAEQLDESVREKYRQLWHAVEQGKAERG